MKYDIYNRAGNKFQVEAKLVFWFSLNRELPGEHGGEGGWIISSEIGVLGVAIGFDCEQDALDGLIDNDLGDSLIIDSKEPCEETCFAGNYDEPVDLSNVRFERLSLQLPRDYKLVIALAECRGAGHSCLNDL